MQLKPGEQFTIVRQLDNPADTGTYYVQAVVRNSKTDAIYATLNLEDKGSQRFTKQWQVVADSTGEGMYIDIESRVFTDSGYTTYSDIYSKENNVLLVADRPYNFSQGGDYGADIDYKKIESFINKAINGQKPIEIPKFDISPIMEKLSQLGAKIEGIEPAEKVELKPIMDSIKGMCDMMNKNHMSMGKMIDDKEVTEATDISKIEKEMAKITGIIEKDYSTNLSQEDYKKVMELLKSTNEKVDSLPLMVYYRNGEIPKENLVYKQVETKRIRKI